MKFEMDFPLILIVSYLSLTAQTIVACSEYNVTIHRQNCSEEEKEAATNSVVISLLK